ncbi:integrase, catalytic region, zinc finger, CCHC-type containing protein [Tanacetum coccineum]|uniref:Integrase, catalytic region, zinc finger, CCHC-type containing protein n=1 Tax=Tanacetum coccineum TaxID=301880 RepID=A0ABQ5EMP4_9ASTR
MLNGCQNISFRKTDPVSNFSEMRSFQMKQSVNKTNVSDGLFKQVTQQNFPQNRKQVEIHSNVLKPGMYRIATTTTQNREPQLPHASRNTNPHVSKSSGVNHTTSVSRPQLKCYQVKDKVVPNNSQVKFKKKEVEDHHRISNISNKTKSVTACNDSSNSKTYLKRDTLELKKLRITNVLGDIINSLGSNLSIVSIVLYSLAIMQLILIHVLTLNDKAHRRAIQAVVGQFCDADLEVTFRKSTCFVRDIQGNDLITGNLGSDLYIIFLQEITSSTPICFMAKASPTQAWLWHRRLSHLNFDYITLLSKKDIVTGLPKGTKFLNKTLHAYFKEEGIEHQTSTPRTPEQNGVVERRNRTLVEAARTMLSASKLPLSFWAPHAILRIDQSSYRLMERRIFAPVARLEQFRILLPTQNTQVFSNLSDGRENGHFLKSIWWRRFCCSARTGSLIHDHPENVYILRKAL